MQAFAPASNTLERNSNAAVDLGSSVGGFGLELTRSVDDLHIVWFVRRGRGMPIRKVVGPGIEDATRYCGRRAGVRWSASGGSGKRVTMTKGVSR